MTQNQEKFLTEKDLAKRWNKSVRTLQRKRWLKEGPPYFKDGRVRYRLSDIEAYEKKHMHLQPKNPDPLPNSNMGGV